jgi:hypothetical protein
LDKDAQMLGGKNNSGLSGMVDVAGEWKDFIMLYFIHLRMMILRI